MKVSDSKRVSLLDAILRSPDSKRKKDDFENTSYEVKDRIEIEKGKIFEELKERVRSEPDVRAEKTTEIKTVLETKTYNIRGEIVAKAIIKNHILDAIL
jgi:hypothetical protein